MSLLSYTLICNTVGIQKPTFKKQNIFDQIYFWLPSGPKPFENWTKMSVLMSVFGMVSEIWTIWHPTSFLPFENQTCPVFVSPLYFQKVKALEFCVLELRNRENPIQIHRSSYHLSCELSSQGYLECTYIHTNASLWWVKKLSIFHFYNSIFLF